MGIEASRASSQALISTLRILKGFEGEDFTHCKLIARRWHSEIIPMAIKLLIAVGLLFYCADGELATPSSCTSIGAYNALL